jgi:hypothetical protein
LFRRYNPLNNCISAVYNSVKSGMVGGGAFRALQKISYQIPTNQMENYLKPFGGRMHQMWELGVVRRVILSAYSSI